MSESSVVVSGRRLAEMFEAVEHAPAEPAETDNANEVALSLGLGMEVGRAAKGLEIATAAEAVEPELSDLERASMLLRFNAAVRMLKDEDHHPGVFSTTENQIAALIQSAMAARASEDPSKVSPASPDGREAKFDEWDVRWALSLITWVGRLRPHRWMPLPAGPEVHPGDLRMALMGDWGTGLYGAPACRDSILKESELKYVIHLGDVYYSGTSSEVRKNFLDFWPRATGASSRACNGNHEMYSGGYGYFDTILAEFGQPSSCFAIQNPDWLIIGLDSAYQDHDLGQNQNAWIKALADASGGRKIVLFTHHQPFSHFDGGGEKLVEKLLPFLSAQRITAWYWGHEHRCVIYDKHPRWNFHGRCVGHGGYPYFREPSLRFQEILDPPMVKYGFWRELPANPQTLAPRAILLDGRNPYVKGHEDDYGPNGYLTLSFKGPKLVERYYLPDGGEPLFTNEIV